MIRDVAIVAARFLSHQIMSWITFNGIVCLTKLGS